ncbi:zinc-ribbon domain-containing protein [Candidatus Pelagibacter sp.]|nr:zinc-ribbon domain-containing protein [Candidatus Pelagibacter sp.]
MIIECPTCSKKFNIDEKLIPDEGRLLKCGNCEHTWFFKKEEKIKLDTETTKINQIEENKSEINIESVEEPIKQTKKIRKKITKKNSTKESTSKELVSIDKSSVSRENNIIKKYF